MKKVTNSSQPINSASALTKLTHRIVASYIKDLLKLIMIMMIMSTVVMTILIEQHPN
jgi:hypothetical protein